MTKFVLLSTSLAAILVTLLPTAPAQAQLNHTWVASNGSDAATCDRPTPCATFTGAFGKTNAGGEITCVDSGNYGGLSNINKSITINCEAAIGSNTEGINARQFIFNTAVTDTVTLRGLDLDGLGIVFGGSSALIVFQSAGVLQVEKAKISNSRGNWSGIQFWPTGAAKLLVSDSSITNNGSTGTFAGINIRPASGVQANIAIDRTRVENNFFGIIADGTAGGSIRGMVSDSVVSGNVNNGITVTSSGAGSAVLAVENTKVSGNNFGLVAAGASSGMLVSQSSIVLNNTGLFTVNGGVLLSYKNNNLNGNTSGDGAFTGIIAQQ